jgi:hypothetical protein
VLCGFFLFLGGAFTIGRAKHFATEKRIWGIFCVWIDKSPGPPMPLGLGTGLRGGNALQFQIASQASTAISTFRTTPPPAVLAPGPLQFQGVAGATVPHLPRLSGYHTCSARKCRVPDRAAGTRSTSSTDFSDHRRLLLISYLSQPPPKKCQPPAVRPAELCLRRPCGAGLCDPANPCSFTGSPASPRPRPLQFRAHCLPCGTGPLTVLKSGKTAYTRAQHWEYSGRKNKTGKRRTYI